MNPEKDPDFEDVAIYGARSSREYFRTFCELQFESFLRSRERILLDAVDNSPISIVLVTHNHAALTYACLQTLLPYQRLAFELVIVDNGSTDSTGELLQRIFGARVERFSSNQHFLAAANHGALISSGQYVLFLNNDLLILPGTLDALLNAFRQQPRIGAVGGKLIRPDGFLQEAGSVILSDGSTMGIGRGLPPFASEVNDRREVDYCSGALLATPRQLFLDMGMFDNSYAPAYYEDVDYCVRLQQYGYRVFYEPGAAAIHLHHGSDPKREDASRLMRAHRDTFVTLHTDFLKQRLAERASTVSNRLHVLYVDDHYPDCKQGQGQPRSAKILEALLHEGASISFFSSQESSPSHMPPDRDGRIALLPPGKENLEQFLLSSADALTHILICRPTNMEWFLHIFNRNRACLRKVRILYDTEAIFALRDITEQQIRFGKGFSQEDIDAIVSVETSLANIADIVLTVSELDTGHYLRSGCTNVEKLSYAPSTSITNLPWELRTGLITIGPVSSPDTPNGDALYWIKEHLIPHLSPPITSSGITVVGEIAPHIQSALNHPPLRLVGVLPELAPALELARVFIAPTRFGAGLPLKVIEAAAAGVPSVISPLLADQLGWTHEIECLIADTPQTFAGEINRLYTSKPLWDAIRGSALQRVAVEFNQETIQSIIHRILSL